MDTIWALIITFGGFAAFSLLVGFGMVWITEVENGQAAQERGES